MIAWLCAAVVGVVFALAGASKIMDWNSWFSSARSQGLWKVVALVLPGLELLLGALLVVAPSMPEVLGISTLLLLIFTVYLGARVATKSTTPCACFGARVSRPPSWRDILRNVVLIALLFVSAALQ